MRACIICQKEITGNALRVKEDFIILGIRRAKQALHMAKNNELFVCENDVKTHQQKRKNYERDLVIFSVIAAIVFVALIVIPILSGKFNPIYILSSIFLSFVIILVPVFFKYAPAVEQQPVTAQQTVEVLQEKPKPLETKIIAQNPTRFIDEPKNAPTRLSPSDNVHIVQKDNHVVVKNNNREPKTKKKVI